MSLKEKIKRHKETEKRECLDPGEQINNCSDRNLKNVERRRKKKKWGRQPL